jgi:hypothetical protein
MKTNTAEKDDKLVVPEGPTVGLKKATWSYIIPSFREPTPEERAEGKTCNDKIIIEIAADQLDGYFRAQGHRGVSKQIEAVIAHQLGGVREELVTAVSLT